MLTIGIRNGACGALTVKAGAPVGREAAKAAVDAGLARNYRVYATVKFAVNDCATKIVAERAPIEDPRIALFALRAGKARLDPPLPQGLALDLGEDPAAKSRAERISKRRPESGVPAGTRKKDERAGAETAADDKAKT